MKKIMFFALAAAGLFASCSSDDALTSDVQNPVAEEFEGRTPILVNLGKAITVETRGHGTIGRDSLNPNAALTNKWYENQAFNLYMFKKDTLDLAMEGTTPIFENEVFKISADQTTDSVTAWPIDLQQRYYPQSGAYDFWAYRLDDAGTAAPQLHTTGTKADSLTVAFNIDGSQDLMVAKAAPMHDLPASVLGQSEYEKRIYSAWSARRGVNPNLNFSHLLTRLHFEVKAGEDLSATPITVDSIIVLSKRTGYVVIAYDTVHAQKYVTPDVNGKDSIVNRIFFNPQVAGQDSMILKDYPAALTPGADNKLEIKNQLTTLNGTTATPAERVGEALLVAPGETEYQLIVKYKQEVPTTVNSASPASYKYFEDNTSKITLTNNAIFQPGTSYKVTIKFYGAQPIVVSASLVNWANGEDVDIDPDENWTE